MGMRSMKQNDQQGPRIRIVGGGVAGLILVWKAMPHTFAAGTWNIYEQQVHINAVFSDLKACRITGRMVLDIDGCANRRV